MNCFLIGSVRFYQKYVSWLTGDCCRFEPSCSQYFIDAVEKHGAWKGFWKGVWRICRCNPLGGSGKDPE